MSTELHPADVLNDGFDEAEELLCLRWEGTPASVRVENYDPRPEEMPHTPPGYLRFKKGSKTWGLHWEPDGGECVPITRASLEARVRCAPMLKILYAALANNSAWMRGRIDEAIQHVEEFNEKMSNAE